MTLFCSSLVNGGKTGTFAMLIIACGVANAQNFSPFSDFLAMSEDELQTLQMKLTYVGMQTIPTQTVVFTGQENLFNLETFIPFRRPAINYVNDSISVEVVDTTTTQLRLMIENVGTLPEVTEGDVADVVFLSFALVNPQPMVKGFEAILDQQETQKLFEVLRMSVGNDAEGVRRLSGMACVLDVLEPQRPTDVGADASVVFGGVRLSPGTGRFVGTAVLTNNSTTEFPKPISIVLELQGNVILFNADGETCATVPGGRPFVNLDEPLGAGQSAEVKLEFENPDLEKLKIGPRVLVGRGAR